MNLRSTLSRSLVGLGLGAMLVTGLSLLRAQAELTQAGGSGGGPKQVLIIRHGEKPGDPALEDSAEALNLSTRGYERAGALAPYVPATFPTPDFLIATQASPKSNRPVETITPLASALKLAINSTYPNEAWARLATDVRTDPKYTDKRVLICWHHGKIPDLAHALGVHPKPDKWPDDVFDRVYQIDYVGGQATLTDVPQRLLFGDAHR